MNPVRRSHEVGQARTAVVEIHPKKTSASKEIALRNKFSLSLCAPLQGVLFLYGDGNMDEEESTLSLKRLRARSFYK